ncbi:uncharacterized protein N7518_002757 [Penicillium psychrosexuale]|uniref:uncharacterized protein n=1 Tax=Penicillium psychrosexuale TaxID=1002107 RepID=UPI002545AD1E|nr:uncharacterized protein N7518_002757 [Penicillium psychrosexuale]KAJ5800689.1 hypothetical protein N7518_002757 [Penicillium psychrosexuale]
MSYSDELPEASVSNLRLDIGELAETLTYDTSWPRPNEEVEIDLATVLTYSDPRASKDDT